MSYALRVVIHEEQWEKQLEDIVWICHTANIEEVYLKEQCHQILMSTYPLEKHKRMADIYKKIAERLEREGILFSINIATIVGHIDCKLEDKDTLPFEKFVGEDLRTSNSVYCILDEKWQKYACEVVALYAETHPKTLWIDDDFRSLNHSCKYGCFCPTHAKAVSVELGQELTGEEIRELIVKDDDYGKEVRKIWMQINYKGQKKAAARMEQAVHSIDAKIRVGLMNSGEKAHALQGRNMNELLHVFAGHNQPLSRPLGGAYNDCLHEELIDIHQGMALSISQLSEDVEIVSEVENWPHTRYTKSLRITALQMKLHALAGADKISMNVFDFMGTPYRQEMEMVKLIRDNKKEITEIQDLRKGKKQQGVGLLWYPGQVEKLPREKGTLDDLIIKRQFDTLLPMLGIPTCFCESQVNLLSGVNARCCSKEKLLQLLKKGLIVDGKSALYLCEQGFGEYIGCTNTGEYIKCPSAERLIGKKYHGEFSNNLLPTDWVRLEYENENIPLFQYSSKCKILSEYVDKEKRYLGDGIALYENQLGGRVCIIPSHIGAWQFSYRSRSWQMKEIVRWLYKEKYPVLLEDSTNIAPFYYEGEGEGVLALLNTGLDIENAKILTEYKLTNLKEEKWAKEFKMEPLELLILKIRRD